MRDAPRGAVHVEYALLVALLAVVSILALTFVGDSVRDTFVAIGDRLFA